MKSAIENSFISLPTKEYKRFIDCFPYPLFSFWNQSYFLFIMLFVALECPDLHFYLRKRKCPLNLIFLSFLEHYQQQDKLKEVESCLMHLDVTNLDIHQVYMAYLLLL